MVTTDRDIDDVILSSDSDGEVSVSSFATPVCHCLNISSLKNYCYLNAVFISLHLQNKVRFVSQMEFLLHSNFSYGVVCVCMLCAIIFC